MIHKDKKVLFRFRERNTSDARAVVLRQHDETTTRSRVSRQENTVRREEQSVRKEEQIVRKEEQTVRKEEKRGGVTLYKRGELISSARSHPT